MEMMARRRFGKRDKEVTSLSKMIEVLSLESSDKTWLRSATFVLNCHELTLLFLNRQFDLFEKFAHLRSC